MPVLLAALVGLAGMAIVVYWFLRANPSSLAKRARLILLVLAGFGVLLILLASLEFLPTLIPELFGLAGVVITALIARGARQRTSKGFSSPGSGTRTAVRTAFLDAWIDHGSGDMGASVVRGRFAGRTLDGLGEAELRELHGECANDQDSLKILEAYLDRRFGTAWRQGGEAPHKDEMPGPRTDMTRAQALAVLGLTEGAKDADIRAAHRRLIQRVHPDAGGSADLAARINRAKDVLLDS